MPIPANEIVINGFSQTYKFRNLKIDVNNEST